MRWNFVLFCVVTLSGCTQSEAVLATTPEPRQSCETKGLTLFSQGRISDAITAWRNTSSADGSAAEILRVLRSWDAFEVESTQVGSLASALLPCARQGDVGAQVLVGTIALLQPKLDLHAKPEELFGNAARRGHPYALLGLAVLAERKSDRILARKYVSDSIALSPAEMGHRAGLLYLSEIFVPRDPVEGARYTKESADRGSWKSQQLMSVLLSEGIGVEQNLTEAARYERLAAENPSRDDSRNADAAIDSIGPTVNPR
jgi:hypothetical protein